MAEEPDEPGQPNPDDHHMLADLWREHRTPVLVVIAVLTLGLTYVLVRQNAKNAQSTGSATTTGGTPTAQTSDSTTADYALTSYMQSILNALQQMSQSGGGSSGNPPPTSPTPPPVSGPPRIAPGPSGGVHLPPPTLPRPTLRIPTPAPARPTAPEQFVTVGRWTPNPAWNSTLSGIAQHEGISLTRIEQLNPQIQNPNLIYPQQSVRVA